MDDLAPKVGENRPRIGGRQKGTPNKTTAVLKDAILLAAKQVGEDGKGKAGLVGYLRHVAREDVKAFASLLGRVLPLQLSGDPDQPIAVVATIERTIVDPQPRNPHGAGI